jgi:hypothetical protein
VKTLICGGREFCNREYFFWYMDRINDLRKITEVIHGGARGADFLAGEWAEFRGIPCRVFKADWVKYKNGAGPIRNQQMLDEGKPDVVIAFPGGNGTADMMTRSRKAGLYVHEVVLTK